MPLTSVQIPSTHKKHNREDSNKYTHIYTHILKREGDQKNPNYSDIIGQIMD